MPQFGRSLHSDYYSNRDKDNSTEKRTFSRKEVGPDRYRELDPSKIKVNRLIDIISQLSSEILTNHNNREKPWKIKLFNQAGPTISLTWAKRF